MNRNKTHKYGRLISLVLAAAMTAVSMAGCGKFLEGDRNDNVALAKADTSSIFVEVSSPLEKVSALSTGSSDDMGEDGVVFSSVFAKDGLYYTLYSDIGAGKGANLSSFDADGKKEKKMSLPAPKEGSVSSFSADSEGRIFMLWCEENKEGELSYQLVCLGKDQKEEWKKKVSSDEDFEPSGMVTTDDYTVLLTNTDVLLFNNKNGKEKKITSPLKGSIGKICTDSKGEVLILGWVDDDGLSAWRLDSEAMTFRSAKVSGKSFYYSEGIASGSGKYDFYICNEDGIYGFVTDGSKPVRIVDFLASGQEFMDITGLAMLSPESALVLTIDDDMNSIPKLLKKADEKALSGKKILTLGCLSAPLELRNEINRYNRKAGKYRIKLIEYSPNDQDVGVFNTAISSGSIPDIICISDRMPIESYAAKGVFEDIEPYFRGDAELSEKQYFDNILDAYRIDGRMYFITPSFTLMGLLAKQKDFGDVRGMAVSDLDKKIKEKKIKYETALGTVNRDVVMSWITEYSNDQFVDMEKGKCSFNSDDFIDLLKFAARFPKKIRYSDGKNDDPAAWIRAGKQLAEDTILGRIELYTFERYGTFGEPMIMTGYPGRRDSGPVIFADFVLAMSDDAEDKEACWEFMRYFYTDAYQNRLLYSFPVRRDSFDYLAVKSMTPEYVTYTDADGKEVQELLQNTFYVGEVRIDIPLPVQEDIDQIMEWIETADNKSSVDGHITAIIDEETGAFFAGQKSAEQVADIIQRRVSIYIKEME